MEYMAEWKGHVARIVGWVGVDISAPYPAKLKPKRTRREIWAAVQEVAEEYMVQRKPYTVVHIFVSRHGNDYQGFGISKWNPNDAGVPGQDWNPQRGIAIARGRAIADLLDQLEAKEAQP